MHTATVTIFHCKCIKPFGPKDSSHAKAFVLCLTPMLISQSSIHVLQVIKPNGNFDYTPNGLSKVILKDKVIRSHFAYRSNNKGFLPLFFNQVVFC